MKLMKQYCGKEWHALLDFHKKELDFPAKSVIFDYGSPVEGIFFINKGNVKVLSQLNKDEERIIRLANDGMILGHRGIHADTYYIRAVALTEVRVSFLPINVFRAAMTANHKLASYLINFLSDELKDTEDRLKTLMIPDPKIRIAKLVVKLFDSFGLSKSQTGKLAFQLSRHDISNMAGTTYETVIRTLNLFEKNKWIAFEGKELILSNEKALRDLANQT